ncbi:mechanosensitive ion channel [Sphingorhabdus arenilitoris]|uniref:Small-conductance mechanosensitive channel n=1 Tax=Sphingorhabdus arenilitoris TaxID=1490041 RepID=A0ABV8RJI1_9SPHN
MEFMGYAFDQQLAMVWAEKLAIVAVILVLTWVLAKAAKWSFAKLVDAVPLLQRAGGDGESIGMSLGKIVSLLVWLIGLIMILQRLGFTSAIEPIQGLLDNVIGYVPNFLGAAVIFFVGTMVAKIVRELVETSLSTIDFDKWANLGGADKVTGNATISKTLATIVFVLIIIPVAIAALDVLKIPAITDPAKSMLAMVLGAVPLIIGASLILGLGFVIARWVSGLLQEVLPGLGADRAIAELGVLPEGRSASGLIAAITSIAIMIFFAIAATNMLGFPQLTGMLETVLEKAGSVVFGAVLIAFGVVIARILSNLISAASGEGIAQKVVYYVTVGLFIFIGLQQMGIGSPIVEYAFGALMIGSAVAFALAFGLGGRDAAAKVLNDVQSGKSAASPAAKPVVKKPVAKKPVASTAPAKK